MKKLLFFIVALFVSSATMISQEAAPVKSVKTGTYLGKTMQLRDFPTKSKTDYGVDELVVIPNLYEGIVLDENEYVNRGEASLQRTMGTYQNRNIDQNFQGASSAESGFFPPDPTGAVGPDHYVHAVNSLVKIFDKQGNLLAGPTALGSFLGNGGNSGDPIVMYDQLADRWFVSQFGNVSSSTELIVGVSETNDPLGAYNVYSFLFSGFPDYPHYSIWPDGYYLTLNEGGGGGGSNPRSAYVVERDVMLAGGEDPQLLEFEMTGFFSNPTTVYSSGAANLLGTDFPEDSPGFITYLQDDSWSSTITFDHLKVWEIEVDWENSNNSTISAPAEIPLDGFDTLFNAFGVGDIDQPGTSQRLPGQGGIISYASNYRSFNDHNSWLITFNVDVDGANTAGIRWVELRNTDDDSSWSVFQEGTYAPDDGESRFMSTSAMDIQGNIGLAYSVASDQTAVALRYTGRFDGDPAGVMTLEETSIIQGAGVITNPNVRRYGDYAHITMDPDNFTFWSTSQYFSSNNFWASQITSFNLSNGFPADTGANEIVSPVDGVLTDATIVEVLVRNFGTESQSNIPISLTVDGVLLISEVVAGPIGPGDELLYSFTQTVDLSTQGQSYALSANVALVGDQFETNNIVNKTVKHLFSSDIGAAAFVAPVSGEGLGSAEPITVKVTNFGATDQSDIEVSYTLDGNTVTEMITGSLLSQASIDYTFAQTADFSMFGTFQLSSTTSLASDQDTSNDAIAIEIENSFCRPEGDCGQNGGVKQFKLADQDFAVNCGSDGYSDDTGIVFDFNLGDNPFEGRLQGGSQNVSFVLWIDFNDNMVFEAEEVVLNGLAPQPNLNVPFTIDFSTIPSFTAGMHLMRLRGGIDEEEGVDILNPCDALTSGRTNDFTANVSGTLGVSDLNVSTGDLEIITLQENKFDVQLNRAIDEQVYIGVYNIQGQQLKNKPVARRNDGHGLVLDMSKMAAGVYIVRLGTTNPKKYDTAKIIVR